MHRLIYRSVALRPFTTAEIAQLLTRIRKRNASIGVTGILIMRHPYFMQLLEGEAQAVGEVLERVRSDGRHKDIRILLEEHDVSTRLFADWAMAFRDASAPSLRMVPGFSGYLDPPFSQHLPAAGGPAEAPALAILERFRAGH